MNMNKYQEALNDIKAYINIYDYQMKQKELEILQKLIDGTEELVDTINELYELNKDKNTELSSIMRFLKDYTKVINLQEDKK